LNNFSHGQGKYTYEDKTFYEGNWVEGKKNGNG